MSGYIEESGIAKTKQNKNKTRNYTPVPGVHPRQLDSLLVRVIIHVE